MLELVYLNRYLVIFSIDCDIYLGVCGLVAAKFCQLTVLTDYQDIVLDLLDSNVKKNLDVVGRKPEEVQVKKLYWGEGLEEYEKEYEGGFDIIIGSEIM